MCAVPLCLIAYLKWYKLSMAGSQANSLNTMLPCASPQVSTYRLIEPSSEFLKLSEDISFPLARMKALANRARGLVAQRRLDSAASRYVGAEALQAGDAIVCTQIFGANLLREGYSVPFTKLIHQTSA